MEQTTQPIESAPQATPEPMNPMVYINSNLKSYVQPKDVVASLAYWGVTLHPFLAPDNLMQCLEDAYAWLSEHPLFKVLMQENAFFPVVEFGYNDLHHLVIEMVSSLPNVRQWNISKAERNAGVTDPDDPNRVGFIFVSRYDTVEADHGFIDLGALARNVTNTSLFDNYHDTPGNIAEMQPDEAVAKPPLGITPKLIWNESRVKDLLAAIKRYEDAGLPIPKEWKDELYGDLLNDYHRYKMNSRG